MKTKAKPKPKPKSDERVIHLPDSDEALLSRKQVARLLSISLSSLQRMVGKGEFPKPNTHLGEQQPRWRRATYEAWVRKRCGIEEES